MTNVTLDLNGGEVWLQVSVLPADVGTKPCHWVFDMTMVTTPNVTKDIPPVQDGPDKRPLGAPGTLIGSPAAWNLQITNLTTDKAAYEAMVRIFQVAANGKETEKYAFKKKVDFDPSKNDPAKPNPRVLSEGLQFVMK